MTAIPFPISSEPGARPQEGAGRLINAYAIKVSPGGRSPVVWKRTAGLRELLNITGHSHFRGAILVASTLLVVLDTRVYAVTQSGGTYSALNLGALAGTGRVTISKNNAGTPNIVAVTDSGAVNLFTASAPTAFVDSDLPVPNSVAHLDGYLLFTIGDGRIFATGLNAVTVSTSSYTTEQGLTTRRGVVFRGFYFVFGDKWTAVYRNAATSPFPLDRHLVIPRGICGTHAIAGWEEGWANDLIWVGEDSVVYRLDGYTPASISTPDVVRAIETCADRSLLEASVYMSEGHAFWTLTSPGEWTWEFNRTTQNWNEKQSYGRDDWRGCGTVWAFDNWITGDRETGKLYKIDPSYYREENDPLIWEVQSGVVSNFPSRFTSPRADFDLTAAIGSSSGEDPIQTDPSVQISWSDDGGYSYNNPVTRRMGGEGDSKKLVSVKRTGLVKSKGRRFKLQVSDPVHVGMMGVQTVTKQTAP